MNDNKRHINKEVTKILRGNKKAEPAFDGTVLEGRERRYTVINERDRKLYLSRFENAELDKSLDYALSVIEQGRMAEGKEPFNSYLVINVDEPYADEVVDIMKKGGHMK